MIQPEVHNHLGILSPVVPPSSHWLFTAGIFFSFPFFIFLLLSVFPVLLVRFFFLGLIAGCGGLGRLGCGKMPIVVCFSNSLFFVCKMQCFLSMLHSCLIKCLKGIWPLEGLVGCLAGF